MTQNIKTKVIEESLDIAQSLEKTRDIFHKDVKPGLYYETISLYLVNFCVRYPMLLHELIERDLDESNSADIYKTVIGIQGDSRYLFELFLTTCHLLNQPLEKRETICLSLRLAELLHIHKQDKVIDGLGSNIGTQVKLSSNNETYKNILRLAKKYQVIGLPADINDCYKVPIEKAGLVHYPNAKINYKNEWENNKEIEMSLAGVKENFERIAQPLYALFSLHEHPSYTSVEKLNNFIKLDLHKRLEKIEHEKFQTLSMIKPIAKAMDLSCKRNLIELE